MKKQKDLFIGIDLGTNGIKAGIIDPEGNVIDTSYRETELASSGVDKMEQDIDYFYISTLKIIRDLIEKNKIEPSFISSLSIDGQMGGVVGIDRDFNSVTGLDMGLDTRSERYNELIHQRHAEEITSISCGSPRNVPKMMWWKKEYPDIYKEISKFVTLNGYVSARMCGLKSSQAFIDYTLLCFFGNGDALRLSWSKELSSIFGIDPAKLPLIVKPWKRIGGMTGEACSISGLLSGTPVMAGAGDQPAGFLGAGMLQKDSIIDISGSSTIMQLSVDEFRPDIGNRTVMYMPSVLKGMYHAFIYINGGGITLRWFKEQFLSENSEIPSEDLYRKMEDKSSNIPAGSEGLMFLPYLGGRQCPYSESLRGLWLGINWGHRKEHFYRTILESLAYDYKLGFDALKTLFSQARISNIPVTGGGSRSDLFNQVKADVMGIRYTKTIDEEFAVRGSGIIAGHGVGAFKDIKKASTDMEILGNTKVYDTDEDNRLLYSKYLDIFKHLVSRPLSESYDKLYRSLTRH